MARQLVGAVGSAGRHHPRARYHPAERDAHGARRRRPGARQRRAGHGIRQRQHGGYRCAVPARWRGAGIGNHGGALQRQLEHHRGRQWHAPVDRRRSRRRGQSHDVRGRGCRRQQRGRGDPAHPEHVRKRRTGGRGDPDVRYRDGHRQRADRRASPTTTQPPIRTRRSATRRTTPGRLRSITPTQRASRCTTPRTSPAAAIIRSPSGRSAAPPTSSRPQWSTRASSPSAVSTAWRPAALPPATTAAAC